MRPSLTTMLLAGLAGALADSPPIPMRRVERDFGLGFGSLDYGLPAAPGGAFGRSKGRGTKAQQNPATKREKRRVRKAMRKRSRR